MSTTEVIDVGNLPVPLPSASVSVDAPAKSAPAPQMTEYEEYCPDRDAPPMDEEQYIAPENSHRRRQIIRQISSYKAMFSPHLTDIESTIKNLDTLAVFDLELLLCDVQFMVESRQSAKMARGTFLGGMTMIEGVAPALGIRLEGLSNMAAQSENLLECVDEVYLKHAPAAQDPLQRLGIELARMCLTLDRHNRACDPQPQITESQQKLAKGL